MASFAAFTDIEAVWRSLTTDEQSVATALAEYASALLRAAVVDIDDRVADGTLDAALPRLAVVQMVIRVLRNPSGLRSESTGPFSATWDVMAAAGRLSVNPEDLELINGPRPRRVRNINLHAGLR